MNMEYEGFSDSCGVRTLSLAVGDHCTINYASSACVKTGASKSELS